MQKPPKRMTPNQIVAWNLQSARTWGPEEGRLTQAEMVERLEPYGVKLSRAAYSAAESSWRGKRIRHFSADEIHAFARVLDMPFSYFFEPPPDVEEVAPEGASETIDRLTALDLCHSPDFDFHLRLEFSPEISKLISKWARAYGGLEANRKFEIEALVKAHAADEDTGLGRPIGTVHIPEPEETTLEDLEGEKARDEKASR